MAQSGRRFVKLLALGHVDLRDALLYVRNFIGREYVLGKSVDGIHGEFCRHEVLNLAD